MTAARPVTGRLLPPPGRLLRAAAVVLGLGASFGVQASFFARYPQPVLFGDPAGYLLAGRTLNESISRLLAGASWEAAFEPARGTLHYIGVAFLYGALDAVRCEDLAFFRLAFAGFNTLALLGAFLLARRLSGFWGGMAALALGVLHPSFPTHTGRLYPDPVTACLFVWAAYLFAKAVQRESVRWMAAAGVTLSLALVIRSQLLSFLPPLLLAACALAAPLWRKSRSGRRLVASLLLPIVPVLLAWMLVSRFAGAESAPHTSDHNFPGRQAYPYGFWQYLETDGWEGPYRLRAEPYYQALKQAAASDPALLRSRPRQLRFTAGYVAARPVESVLMVLDNVYRTFDRPANPYRWGYPFGMPLQGAYQKAVLLLAIACLVSVGSARPLLAGAYFIPLALAMIHGLSFPWPRYGFPALPILLALAGVYLAGVCERLRLRPLGTHPAFGRLLVVLGASIAALLLGSAARALAPELARLLSGLAYITILGCFFWSSALAFEGPRAKAWAVAAFALVALPAGAHLLRDGRWHEREMELGRDAVAVEQQIDLQPEALSRLRLASEAFVVFDLTVPSGDPRGLQVRVGETTLPGSALQPTMPRLREATETGGRNWREYPQWWALPLTKEMLPAPGTPLRVELRVTDASRVRVYGDRFTGQEREYRGPSFGDWPHLAAGKLEYDGDYRLFVEQRIASYATRSLVVQQDGTREEVGRAHRIRLITLASNEGSVSWEMAPAPGGVERVFGFWGYSGDRGQAELAVNGRPALSFPLGARQDFVLEQAPFRLCHLFEGIRGDKAYGAYVLEAPSLDPGPARLEVSFRSGMSIVPMFFVVERKRPAEELEPAFDACGIGVKQPRGVGLQRLIDASRNTYPAETGRWRIDEVF